jgi:hypothetical protein
VVEEEAALKNLLVKKMVDSVDEEVRKALHQEVEEDLTDQTDLKENREETEGPLVDLEENVEKVNPKIK